MCLTYLGEIVKLSGHSALVRGFSCRCRYCGEYDFFFSFARVVVVLGLMLQGEQAANTVTWFFQCCACLMKFGVLTAS